MRSTPGRQQLLDYSHEMAQISFNEHKSWHRLVASRIVSVASRQKDLSRFAWSESHPLFQAGTADTCGLPGMLPNDHLTASRYCRLRILGLEMT